MMRQVHNRNRILVSKEFAQNILPAWILSIITKTRPYTIKDLTWMRIWNEFNHLIRISSTLLSLATNSLRTSTPLHSMKAQCTCPEWLMLCLTFSCLQEAMLADIVRNNWLVLSFSYAVLMSSIPGTLHR